MISNSPIRSATGIKHLKLNLARQLLLLLLLLLLMIIKKIRALNLYKFADGN